MAFKGNNGKYLTFEFPNRIMFIRSSPFHSTRFYASRHEQKLLLQARNGKYLSRVRLGNGIDRIMAVKKLPDQYCLFTVHNQADGTVVLQADNGKYMSRVNRGADYFEAVKKRIDSACKLRLEFQL